MIPYALNKRYATSLTTGASVAERPPSQRIIRLFATHRRTAMLVILCCLILGAAPAISAQTATQLTPITLQLKWKDQFQFAGYYAAQQQGFYRDAGLDVTIVEAQDGQDPIATVVDGEAEYGVGTTELVLWRSQGAPVVVLGVIFQHSPLVLLTTQDSGLDSLHMLGGKQVAIEANSAELLAYLQDEGIDRDDLQIVSHHFTPNALINGTVDAMSAYSTDEPFMLTEADVRYNTFSPRSAGIDFYGDVLFTTEAQIRQNPQQVQAFFDASMRGWEYAFEHEDELIDYIYNDLTQRHSLEHLRFEAGQMRRLIQPDLIEPGYMYEGRWRYIVETYARVGLIPDVFPISQMLYTTQSNPDLLPLYTGFLGALIVIGAAGIVLLRFYRLNVKLRNQIAERAEAQKRLVESEERYRSLVEAAPFPVVMSSLENGTISYLNPSAEALLKVRREDAVGTPAVAMYSNPDDRRLFVDSLQERGHLSDFEVRLHNSTGHEFWASFSATIMIYEGRPSIFLTFKDMTEHKRAEAQSFALAVEQERVKVLSAFIQNASHEFRTPLAIIGSSIYLLSKAGDEENRHRHVEKAENQIKHITHLLEILIAMTQLDSGAPLDCKPIDLTAMVDELAFIVGWEISKRKLNLNLQTPKKDVMIQGDFDRLHAALRHVLENAQRYTPPGGTITISLDTDYEQKRAVIRIRDTGAGISAEALPHIFERFWREDNAHTTPGFGIGLPLAQKIVAAHGGGITVESEPGEGSTFVISLPLAPENLSVPNPTD